MKHACKHPPRHVVAVIGFLRGFGADVSAPVLAKRHRLAFTFRGRLFQLALPRTQSVGDALRHARIAVHRLFNQAGFALPVPA